MKYNRRTGALILPETYTIAKKRGKTRSQWLYSVYRKNKAVIDAGGAVNVRGNYSLFRIKIDKYEEMGFTLSGAVNAFGRSHNVVTDKNEYSKLLFEAAMVGKKSQFFKETGSRFTKDNLAWDSANKQWKYQDDKGNTIAVFEDLHKTGYKKGRAVWATARN